MFAKKIVKMIGKIKNSGVLWKALAKLEGLKPSKRSRDSVMERVLDIVEQAKKQKRLDVALWMATYSNPSPISSNSQRHVKFNV